MIKEKNERLKYLTKLIDDFAIDYGLERDEAMQEITMAFTNTSLARKYKRTCIKEDQELKEKPLDWFITGRPRKWISKVKAKEEWPEKE